MKKLMLFVLCLIFIYPNVNAALIQGTVYDISLNKLENVILVINTEPEQKLVLMDSNYSLNLPKGSYNIKAFYYENRILEASSEQEISVASEGNYTLDLILFPSLEEEDILFNQSNFEFQEDIGFEKKVPTLFLIAVGLAVVLFIIFKFKKKPNKKELEKELETKFDDIYLNNVINLIKKNEGRMTQKDIRKELKISEAKVSLILTQLESEGRIKKIKKGRGNIVILNKN